MNNEKINYKEIGIQLNNICKCLEEQVGKIYDVNEKIESWNNDCRLTEAIRSVNVAIANLYKINFDEEIKIRQEFRN